MDTEAKAHRRAWRAQARKDLSNPRLWIFFACLYVIAFVLTALLMFAANLIVPHLPWISQPYVDPNPPPLVTAFYFANLIPVTLVVAMPLLYLWGGRRIPFLSAKKVENNKT